MSTTITLYEVEEFNKDKNFIIESIADLLSSITTVKTFTTGQYIKHALHIVVKLPLEQEYFYTKRVKYNYCKITNPDENSYTAYSVYYFINNIEWVSKTVIRLDLTMDTLNTFKLVSDYQLSHRTLVKREHKNRFKIDENDNVLRVIDIINEGINPSLFKVSETELIRRNYPFSWYLVYQNNDAINPDSYNQVNPVSCYLVPENDLEILYNNTEHEIDLTTFNDGAWYIFNPVYNQIDNYSSSMKVILNGVEYELLYDTGYSQGIINSVNLYIHKVNNDYIANIYSVYKRKSVPSSSTLIATITLTTFKIPAVLYAKYRRQTLEPVNYTPQYNEANGVINFTTTSGTLKGIASIDRTDPKLVKIIKTPYCPTTYGTQLSGGVTKYYFNENWYFDSGKLNLRYLDTKFENVMASTDNKIFNVLAFTSTPHDTDLASINFESKLYSSEFYQPQFVYDSFIFQFILEAIDIDEIYNLNTLEIKFVQTTTINSRCLFMFPQYILKYSTNAYENVLSVNRNNEVVIYSSQYINYIKSGYNYDVKKKTLGHIETGLASAEGVIKGAIKMAGQDYVGGLSLSGASVFNGITSAINRELDFERNISMLRNESTSVSGADDIDLLDAYSNNRAKTCIYQATDVMRNYVYHLFRFYGYACNEIKKPVVNSRIRYNFLQADVDFEMADIKIEQDILEDIKGKYSQGVTFIHKYNGTWDLEQKYENWETIFFS